jgi:hypothetical protein
MIGLVPMNNTVFCGPNVSDDIRRQQRYDGQLFVYAARPSVLALANFARSMIEDAFGGLDPRTAQRSPPRLSKLTTSNSWSAYANRSRG